MSNANRKGLRIAAAAVAIGGFAVVGSSLAMGATRPAPDAFTTSDTPTVTATPAASVTPAVTATPTVTATPINAPTPIMSPTPTPTPTTAMPVTQPGSYMFTTLDNQNDPTFNQLLGINAQGVIAGYFGSGAQNHPNKGYLLFPPYGQQNYAGENFPGSVQTQVTGLNDNGDTVGFWSSMNTASGVNNNFGFYKLNGHSFHSVNFPTGDNASPPVNQLLGINDHDIAVGFYTNGGGLNRGYIYNINTRHFTRVQVPGYQTGVNAPSLTAAGINNHGDVTGFYTDRNGVTDAFLAYANGKFLTLDFPGASATQALGVNDHDELAGVYTDGTGDSATMHGFTWTPGGGFTTVDDPHGVGTTTINGVNDDGDLVGFYTDSAGNTDGLLATPVMSEPVTTQLNLMSMPQGTATLGRDNFDTIDVTVDAFGLTPGSSHGVELVNGLGKLVTVFQTLTANGTGGAQATLDSTYKGTQAPNWRVVILNGTAGDPVSTEPIAESSPTTVGANTTYPLTAVEVDPTGMSYGTPQGTATLVYNPSAQTISVTLNASGLTPGAHAAHIHVGSCQSQGPVQYMFMDFTANSDGQIVNQTQTVTGVTTPVPATGWYLNLHQGNSNNILSNGQPTINFRPLLCADL